VLASSRRRKRKEKEAVDYLAGDIKRGHKARKHDLSFRLGISFKERGNSMHPLSSDGSRPSSGVVLSGIQRQGTLNLLPGTYFTRA